MKNKSKEKKQYDLTPEQQEKLKKFGLAGIIILGVLLITLITTVLTIFLVNREKAKKPIPNPLSEIKLAEISGDNFQKYFNEKSVTNNLKNNLSENAKNQIEKDQLYILFYNKDLKNEDRDILKKLSDKINDKDKKDTITYGFLINQFDQLENEKISKNNITYFYETLKKARKNENEDKTKFDENLKKEKSEIETSNLIIIKIDTINFNNEDTYRDLDSYYVIYKHDEVVSKLNELVK